MAELGKGLWGEADQNLALTLSPFGQGRRNYFRHCLVQQFAFFVCFAIAHLVKTLCLAHMICGDSLFMSIGNGMYILLMLLHASKCAPSRNRLHSYYKIQADAPCTGLGISPFQL